MINIKDVEKFNSILKEKKLTIVCAESITAGLLASTIASISGASDILKGSIVTYSRELKTFILGVDPRIIDKHTAESMETTVEMVYGLTKVSPSADIYVAVTGVASLPTNNYKINKEVGQIYVAIYYGNCIYKLDTIINDPDRNIIRAKTVEFIFNSIKNILNDNIQIN